MRDRKVSDFLLKPEYTKKHLRMILEDKLDSALFTVFLNRKSYVG